MQVYQRKIKAKMRRKYEKRKKQERKQGGKNSPLEEQQETMKIEN